MFSSVLARALHYLKQGITDKNNNKIIRNLKDQENQQAREILVNTTLYKNKSFTVSRLLH